MPCLFGPAQLAHRGPCTPPVPLLSPLTSPAARCSTGPGAAHARAPSPRAPLSLAQEHPPPLLNRVPSQPPLTSPSFLLCSTDQPLSVPRRTFSSVPPSFAVGACVGASPPPLDHLSFSDHRSAPLDTVSVPNHRRHTPFMVSIAPSPLPSSIGCPLLTPHRHRYAGPQGCHRRPSPSRDIAAPAPLRHLTSHRAVVLVSVAASHLARRVGLAPEVLPMPTLPCLNVRLAVVARATTPTMAALAMPHAHACTGWPRAAGLVSPAG
jgi:hypothetical protein